LADAKIFLIENDRPVRKNKGAGGIWSIILF